MAGLTASGPTGSRDSRATQSDGGILGDRARSQYSALTDLRWHMFINGIRSNHGVFELGARAFSYVIYGCMGLGLGALMGGGSYLLISHDQWKYLPAVFWVMFLIWQVVPIALASFQEQFDLGILLRFPVKFGSFFLLYIVFGLVDISTILGVLCCTGVWIGITWVRPDLFAWTTLALFVFAIFNILTVRAIFAWIDRWLAQRKTREIVGALFLVAVLSLQLFNPALRQSRHNAPRNGRQQVENYRRMGTEIQPWLQRASQVERWLPPGLAARILRRAAEQQPGLATGSSGLLALYVLAAGGVLAARLKAEYRGENLGQAPRRKTADPARGKKAAIQNKVDLRYLPSRPGSSSPIAAVIEKEIRSLLRTLPLLYAVGAPLVLVLVFSGVFIRGGGPQGHVFSFALPLCMIYAQLGFTQVFYNNLGAEGAGIQLYFLSPTPIKTVMFAKNLLHSLMFGIVALTAAVLTGLRLGTPDATVAIATAAWLLFALPCNLAAGNVFSIKMPYRVNPGRISRQRGSQANALLSLLIQLGIISVGATVFAICSLTEKLWLAIPIFLVLAAIATFVWTRVLNNTDQMANGRRDLLIATLMKTE